MAAGSLEDRLAKLEALHAIGELKSRYSELADAKYTSAHQRVGDDDWRKIAHMQAECFTDDAQWFGGTEFGGTLTGRAALAEWFARSPWRFALHYYVAPSLSVIGPGSAEGRWRLWQLGVPLDAQAPVLLAGTTFETYRVVDGEWRIASMRFDEIHTVDLSLAPAVLRCVLPRSDA